MTLEAIILAAGEGTRMRSALPKPLHPIGGKPMLAHVIVAAAALKPAKIHVVLGHHAEVVQTATESAMAEFRRAERYGNSDESDDKSADAGGKNVDRSGDHIDLNWIIQRSQLGTGHALLQAMPAVHARATVLVLYGDTPLIRAPTLRALLAAGRAIEPGDENLGDEHSPHPNWFNILTADMDDPTGLGRILRDADERVVGIVEERDASAPQRRIRECNTGFIAAPAAVLRRALAKLDNHNAQREFYLTDLLGHAAGAGARIEACQPATAQETFGVNSQVDLARVERIHQLRCAHALLENGVRLCDPARFEVRGWCQFGRDCVVDVNVILEGRVVVGDDCRIGAGAIIRDSVIGAGSLIEAHCVIDGAVIGARCRIGPFARLRPQSTLAEAARIGNFVEIKQSHIGPGSKVNHLSYVGDSSVGTGVNIGAGVITCNYDGARKHRTVIGDDVFVGSNSQLVAPLAIGAGATIGAGSTITKNVAAATLALSRPKQTAIANWSRPRKKSPPDDAQ